MRILVVAAVLALVGCTPPASTPSPTPGASIAVSPTHASTTRVPIPTAGPGTYTSLALEYRLELPAGWRYSQCQSGEDIGGRVASRHESFTSASVNDESWVDATGPAHATVFVSITDNPAGRTALQWLSDGGVGSSNDAFDRATVDGREGAHVMTQAREVKMLVSAARGRVYAITAAGPQGITPDARRIMNSLHILDDAELAAARATLATLAPTAARSAEIVADTLARGFDQKDVSVLATVAWPCISRGFLANNDSGVTAGSTRVLDDLRKAFAAGLTVSVAPRPIAVAAGYGGVEATWTEAGRAPRRAVMNLLLRGDTWYWYAWNITP